jgi:hypothetical protein
VRSSEGAFFHLESVILDGGDHASNCAPAVYAGLPRPGAGKGPVKRSALVSAVFTAQARGGSDNLSDIIRSCYRMALESSEEATRGAE